MGDDFFTKQVHGLLLTADTFLRHFPIEQILKQNPSLDRIERGKRYTG
jgi:hypothetical protein